MKRVAFLIAFISLVSLNGQQLSVVNAEDYTMSAGIGAGWDFGLDAFTATLGGGLAFNLSDTYLDTLTLGQDPAAGKIPSLELLPFLKTQLEFAQIDQEDMTLSHRLIGESLLSWPFLVPFTSDAHLLSLWDQALAGLPTQNLALTNTVGLNSKWEYLVNDRMWRTQGISAEWSNTLYLKNSWIIPSAWGYYKSVLNLRADQMIFDKYLYITGETEFFYKADVYGNVPASDQFLYYPINGKRPQFGNMGYFASFKIVSTVAEFEFFLPFSVSLAAFASSTTAGYASLDVMNQYWSVGAYAEIKTVLLDALAVPAKVGFSWSGGNIEFLFILL